MPSQDFKNLDQFEQFIVNTIRPWSDEKRTVLAAAMAERWLPVYEVFSEKNEWGNPATFRDAVETVWNCVLSHEKLTAHDLKLHNDRMRKDTPHMDDFDCEVELAACAIVSEAMDCCHRDNNLGFAAQAMSNGVSGVAPVLFYEPEEAPANIFRQRRVVNEIERQLKLLDVVGHMKEIHQQHIETLRQKLTSPELRGPIAPRPKSQKGSTNRTIFERYRKTTETENKRTAALTAQANTLAFSIWGGRYLRRKHFIEKLGDVIARDALVKKNLTHAAAVQGDPGWDSMLSFTLRVSYAHAEAQYDVKLPQEPHRYGPSFRQLCIEGGPARAWQWAHHRPEAWDEEDERKELGKLLTRNLSWHTTSDVDHPWATEVSGETWRIRLNDFPDDLMYTLIINDAVIGKFHDWPKSWQREA